MDWRGAGTFDSVAQAEFIMEQIAYELSLDPVEVRLNNLKPEFTSSLVEMYNTLKKDGQYEDRRAFVNQFNKQNRWKKRGLRFSFLNFNVFPYARYNVILSVYFGDGTVVINHGGIEMGQGINTKCAQICAYYLNIPVENIQVKSTNTIISPNCVESGASLTSQNIGLGVFRCCMKLLKRLEPIKAEMPNASWIEVIQTANDSKIDLQVQDFITEDDPARYDYNVFGIALTEVEIDVLTGEYELLRVDILEDVGRSVSPELDVGQVEGAFIMGLGYWTSEKLFYDENTGEPLTNRTWNYKVPMCTDIPQDLRVYFRKNSFTFEPIQGAKIVGEPPLCLSVGIPLAIREAISQARLESNIPPTDWFPIDGPSSVETVGLLSATDLKDLVLN
ncbi:xanthine dehydrogenase/oxidase-like [Trichoplusia ni]|uniref:Xanthine dehydrogenase/oxidase-like n=1 Tax=Trichoplusia ni TaxID=7111 RepID=A0A7E5WMA4_TRINI|nr:xanthine dehydrogenase/oxidase-like [Trichoplusia ni]